MIFFSWMSRDWGTLNVDIYNVIYFCLNELRKVKPQKRVSIHSVDFSVTILTFTQDN